MEFRSITTSDGYQHAIRWWPAVGRPRGVAVVLHGIQSHSEWYLHSSTVLSEAGFEVWFPDRRGSGRNTAGRGHADHGLRLLADVEELLRAVRRSEPAPAAPVVLMGLSWGARIAAAFAATRPGKIERLVLLYPGLCPRVCPTWTQRQLLRLARYMDQRNRRVPVPLMDPQLFTDDPNWQEFIRRDPLALHEVTTGFLNSGHDLDRIIQHALSGIAMPLFVALAGRDQIIDNQATRKLVRQFGSNDVTIRCYEAARHTLEFEPQRDVFLRDLTDWLCRRSADSGVLRDHGRSD